MTAAKFLVDNATPEEQIEIVAEDKKLTEFGVKSKLRELRQTLAKKEAIPVYTIFTNEQLAAMVTQETSRVSQLKEIPGVGEARIDKYGEAFVRVLTEKADEAS